MAKYDRPRKSLPVRHGAYSQAPQYFPTVRRQALAEAGWQQQPQTGAATSATADVTREVCEVLDLVDVIEDDDALPVPEAGVPKETQIVSRRPARRTAPPPLPRPRPVVDPLAMLAAATIWGDRRRTR